MGLQTSKGKVRNSILAFEMDWQLERAYLDVQLQSSYQIMIF